MRKLGIVLSAGVALVVTGVLAPSILFESQDYQVQYSHRRTPYTDARIYSMLFTSRYYVYLPHAEHHAWWLIDLDEKMIYLPATPARRLGLWWRPGGDEPGAAIDFDVKVGKWNWSFGDDEIRFRNDILDCVMIRQQ
jgi:hypothetical protein